MQISSILAALSRLIEPADGKGAPACCGDFSRDPLLHPVVQAMSPRALADLPACELRARGRS